MSVRKLILIVLVVFIINFVGVYFIFYYDAGAYSYIDVGIDTGTFVYYNEKGDKLAFFKKKKNIDNIRVYDIISKNFKDYPLPRVLEPNKAGSLVFSPDSGRIIFIVKEGDDMVINYLNLNDGSIVSLKSILYNSKLSHTESSDIIRAIFWLDNVRIIFVNQVSFERNGMVIVNLSTGLEEKFIDGASKLMISSDKTKLAFVIGAQDGKTFEVKLLNLKDGKISTLAKNMKGYPDCLAWSVQGKQLALGSFSIDENPSLKEVFIINENGQAKSISANKFLVNPQWLDENSLFVIEYETHGAVMKYQSVDGLYLYDLKTKEYKKISPKINSEYYSVSPDKKKIISNVGGRLFILDIERALKPSKLDEMRDHLGIHSL